MNLFVVDIKNAIEKLYADNCTIGQAFTMVDNWCNDNDAWYSLENMWLDTDGVGTRAKVNIKCMVKNTNKVAIVFELRY